MAFMDANGVVMLRKAVMLIKRQPHVCDTVKNCEGLSRVALMDGNGVVMLGKVVHVSKSNRLSAILLICESVIQH